MGERLRGIAEDAPGYATEQRDTELARRDIESAGAEIRRAIGSHESGIYRDQLLRDEQERARYRHEVQERAARVRSGPSMEMGPGK